MPKGCFFNKHRFLAPELICALQPGENGSMICCMVKAERLVLKMLCEEVGSP